MSHNAQIVGLLEALLTEVRKLTSQEPATAEADVVLLREIAAASEFRKFRVADLLDRNEILTLDGDGNLDNALRAVIANPNGRKLGDWLRKLEGHSVEHMCVRREKNSRDGWWWKIVK